MNIYKVPNLNKVKRDKSPKRYKSLKKSRNEMEEGQKAEKPALQYTI